MRLKNFVIPLFLQTLVACTHTNSVEGSKNQSERSNEKSAISRAQLGLAYLKHKETVKARENLLKAYAIDPNNLYVLLSLAHYYDYVGEIALADSMYRKAVAYFPNDGYVMNNYGTFLCKQNQYIKAQEYFKSAADTSYVFIASSYENAGLCSLKSGDIPHANRSFERALAYEPDRIVSLLQSCRIEIEQQQYAKAEAKIIHFHNTYGVRTDTLKMLIELAQHQNNSQLELEYTQQLNQL